MTSPRPKRTRAWHQRHRATSPGSSPGALVADPAAARPLIRVIAYGPDSLVERTLGSLEEFDEQWRRTGVVWLNVDGLGDVRLIQQIGAMFQLHRLALEDVVHVHQRPKVESYDDHLFIVARMVQVDDGQIGSEQLSMFLGSRFLLTFQESHGDCFDQVRHRLRDASGRLRSQGPDYLMYALLDAVIDHYFPVLEARGALLDELEDQIVERPRPATLRRLFAIKRELLLLKKLAWPMRDVAHALIRDENRIVAAEQRVYLRDCEDHTLQILDLLETMRELVAGLMEGYRSAMSQRLAEVMKVLTVIGTIFLPLTFVVGVYGMNFDPDSSPWNMPELRWRYGYPIVLGVMALVAGGMLWAFKRRGWLGGRS
jgi:magnesium transporter